jgi:hypothetical protein
MPKPKTNCLIAIGVGALMLLLVLAVVGSAAADGDGPPEGPSVTTDAVLANHFTKYDDIAPFRTKNDPPPGGYTSYPTGTCGVSGQGFSDPQWVLVGTKWNTPFDPADDKVTTVEGQVTSSKLATDDNPIDHHSRDRNFFIYPDPPFANVLATPGNFETGAGNEHGRIEVEDESASLPAWALPMMGDRVHVEGSWIWDCAHSDYRTEIHPPRLVMTLRDAANQDWSNGSATIPARPGWVDTMPGLGSVPVPVTRADVFGSSDGGEAREQLTCFAALPVCDPGDWYQPLNSKSYDLLVPAPPKPDDGAQLVTKVISRAFPTCTSDDHPCGGVNVFTAHPDRFTFTEEPMGAGEGIHIHIDMTGFTEPPSHLYGFGFTLEVGWNRPATAVPKRFKVTIEGVHVKETLDPHDAFFPGEYEISSLIGDTFKHMILTGNGNHGVEVHEDVPDTSGVVPGDFGVEGSGLDCALVATGGADPGPCQTSFDVTLLPGEPLRVFFRAEEQDTTSQNDEAGVVERIAAEDDAYGVGEHTEWFQEKTSSGFDDLDEDCETQGCLNVKYKIEEDPIPAPPGTALSTGSPSVTLGSDTWVTSATNVALQATAPSGHEGDALEIHARFWRSGTPEPSESVCGTGAGTASCTLHLNTNDGADGQYTVEYWSVDTDTGAVEATQTKSLRLDNTAPTSTASLAGTFVRGWYNTPVTVTLSATDGNGVGVDHTGYVVDPPGLLIPYSSPFVVSGDGSHSVHVSSADKLTNTEPLAQKASFQIDTTPPTLAISDASDGTFSYTQDELVNGMFTNAALLKITYASSDALSGMWEVRIDGTPIGFTGTTYVALPDGVSTHSLVAEDVAGNLTTLTFSVVKVTPLASPEPRGAGFWKNYGGADLATLLSELNIASRAFGAPTNRYADATLANYQQYLTPGANPTVDQKVARELLTAWLNLVSGREPAARQIDLKSVQAWPTVVTGTGGSSVTTALHLVRESEARLEQNASNAILDTIHTLLEKLNADKLK